MRRVTYNIARLRAEWGSGPEHPWRNGDRTLDTSACALCGVRDMRSVTSAGGERGPLAYGYCQGGICRRCGWWNVLGGYSEDDAPFSSYLHYVGEIADFDVRGIDIAGQECAHALAWRYESGATISARLFEETVAAIFREHLDCRVEMTKQTRDGGKDLVCFDANDGKFYVEVKHFAAHRTVGVEVVQRFVGVLYQDAIEKGILVTSSSFSKEAVRAAHTASRRGSLLELELRDHDDLLTWLGAFRNSADEAILNKMREIMPAYYGLPTVEPGRPQ